MKLEEIALRDPFIFADKKTKKYYLYGSVKGRESQHCFNVYESENLSDWNFGGTVFENSDAFWATGHFWAPEVHEIDGKYYMFATFRHENGFHRSQILVSDTPNGRFTPFNEPLTPETISALDATYYEDNGKKYMFYCHEWIQIGDGTVNIQRLDDNLRPTGEPTILFKASDAGWPVTVRENQRCFVTDGPFIRKHNQTYFMLWSSFCDKGYAVSYCTTKNLEGEWTQRKTPLLTIDGGHAMIFDDFNGQTYLTCHSPNSNTEHPVLFKIRITDDEIIIE